MGHPWVRQYPPKCSGGALGLMGYKPLIWVPLGIVHFGLMRHVRRIRPFEPRARPLVGPVSPSMAGPVALPEGQVHEDRGLSGIKVCLPWLWASCKGSPP